MQGRGEVQLLVKEQVPSTWTHSTVLVRRTESPTASTGEPHSAHMHKMLALSAAQVHVYTKSTQERATRVRACNSSRSL